MTEAASSDIQAQPSTAGKVCGILSIVLGGLSLLPFLGLLSLVGIILGIIGIVKRAMVLGIVGLVLSLVGVATSPTVWCLFGGCEVTDTSAMEMMDQ